jgi:hypothetical protein
MPAEKNKISANFLISNSRLLLSVSDVVELIALTVLMQVMASIFGWEKSDGRGIDGNLVYILKGLGLLFQSRE